MKNLISFKRASQFSLILFGLFIVFHLSIIIGILFFDFAPVDYLWGGRMETATELLAFEIISLAVMSICLLVVLIRAEIIKISFLMGLSRIILWFLTFMFLLNTVGNLLAETNFEKFLAIITAMLTVLCLRMALEKIKSA